MALVLVIARRRGAEGRAGSPRRAVRIIVEAFWALLTVVIIIGSIVSGVARTGSAAVACIYAFLVTMFVYRDYKWPSSAPGRARRARRRHRHDRDRLLGRLRLHDGADAGTGESGAVLSRGGRQQVHPAASDQRAAAGARDFHGRRRAPDLPIFLPIVVQFGMGQCTSSSQSSISGSVFLTPPVGPTLAVGCAIGKVSMETLSRAILPFYVPMLFVLILVTYIPALSLWLPSLFRF